VTRRASCARARAWRDALGGGARLRGAIKRKKVDFSAGARAMTLGEVGVNLGTETIAGEKDSMGVGRGGHVMGR